MPPRLFQPVALLLCLLCAAPAPADERIVAQPGIAECRIGFAGRYKLGCWAPVSVRVDGLGELTQPRIEVIAPDGDGSPAVVIRKIDAGAEATKVVNTLIRVGRRDAIIRVRLLDGEQVVAQWRSGQDLDAPVRGLPAASTLIVEADRTLPLAELPTDWLGYEGVDALVVAGLTADQLKALSPEQVQAIDQWIEAGGRLVLCGGEHAGALIGAGAPLESLSPGRFVELARLPNTGVIEDYADSDQAIDAPFGGLAVSRITEVAGAVELFAGGRADEMPLVVRSLRGFGEVTYVAFDPYAPELLRWRDAPRLMSQILGFDAAADSGGGANGPLVATAFEDLTGALHVKLGSRFQGVQTISVLALVAAVALYLALLGPGAYYLGSRVTKRMTTAWVAFPLIALGVGVGAAWWGDRATGDAAQLNKLELIDVDSLTGLERGALWAQAFSPAAELYDLSCTPIGPEGKPVIAERGYLSWFGLPGRGLGGMQTPAGSLLAGDVRHRLEPAMHGMLGAPINRRASKALTARWMLSGQPVVRFELAPTGTGLVDGVITNDTPHTLTDAKLIANGWTWRLPDLKPGDVAVVDEGLSPARLRTLLLKDLDAAQGAARKIAADRLSVPAIAYLMMFYEELGGEAFSPLPALRQPAVDLSHALAVGRPVLVAQSSHPRVQLRRDEAPLAPTPQVEGVFYRFIGPPLTEPDQPE